METAESIDILFILTQKQSTYKGCVAYTVPHCLLSPLLTVLFHFCIAESCTKHSAIIYFKATNNLEVWVVGKSRN